MLTDREKYLNDLRQRLKILTPADQNATIDYYSKYLEEANLTSYQQIVKELGTPQQVSRIILADHTIKSNDQEKLASTKSNWRVYWNVILAIATSPLTFVSRIGLLAVLILALAVVLAITLSIFGIICGLLLATIIMFYVGFATFTSAPLTGLFYCGGGLVMAGLLLVGIPVGYWLLRWLTQAIANIAKFFYTEIQERRKQP